MAVTNGWGKGTQNNSNGWGKFQNTIDAGSVYADSYSGETVLIGASAAFSYSASSFHQGEADPTPTITGTAGGTFSATPSGLSINTSTGTIDLDNSTIQSYTITYTVSGVSANFSLSVTASPFIANTFSFNFDGVNDYIDIGSNISIANEFTVSFWININTIHPHQGYGYILAVSSGAGFAIDEGGGVIGAGKFYFYNGAGTSLAVSTTAISANQWNNVAFVCNKTSNEIKCYINGSLDKTTTVTNLSNFNNPDFIGKHGIAHYLNGKLDEVAIFNTALSSDAVQEIYNATYNNTGKVLDLNTDSGNYTNSSSLQYWNRLGD